MAAPSVDIFLPARLAVRGKEANKETVFYNADKSNKWGSESRPARGEGG